MYKLIGPSKMRAHSEGTKDVDNLRLAKLIRSLTNTLETKEYNFRTMPRRDINLQKKPVKRLQGGPRLTKIDKDRRKETTYVIERLISKLLEEDDVKLVMDNLGRFSISETSRKKAAIQLQKNILANPTNSSDLEEEPDKPEGCLDMLEDLIK